jgi:hypothetical protein
MRKWEMMYCICSKVIDRREELFFPFHKNCAAEMKSCVFCPDAEHHSREGKSLPPCEAV